MNRCFRFFRSWSTLDFRHRHSARATHQYQVMEPRTLMCGTPSIPDANLWASPLQESQLATVQGSPAESQAVIARIVNGVQTSQYPSVGMIGDTTGFFCSGTLIGSKYVLTAAHCAEGVAQTAGRFRVGTQTYSTSRIFIHPGYNPNQIGNDNANDIAIYVLDRDVTGITPTQIYRSTPTVGQLLTLVGFGAGGNGNAGHDGSFGVKRVGTTPIDQVSTKLIRWRFDNNSESNTAPGDSGGPGFVTVNGTLYVAGVTSGGDLESAAIGDNSYDTRVDAYASWIDSIVGSVSAAPTVSISSSDFSAAETRAGEVSNTANFTITRTGSLNSPMSVNLSVGGTAAAGSDYFLLPATVTIPAGSASTTVVLTTKDDLFVEGTETVIVNLTQGSGYQVSQTNPTVTLSILDNETQAWNNQFSNRFVLSGSSATVTGTNVGATRETGEPNVLNVSGGKSVWWTWTAPVTAKVTISTSGSNFDTTLGVYRGSALNQLTLVKANDDQSYWSGVFTSRVTFRAVAGRQYQILVDGYQGAMGSVTLSVQQDSPRRAGRSSEFAKSVRQEKALDLQGFARTQHHSTKRSNTDQAEPARIHSRGNSFGASIGGRSVKQNRPRSTSAENRLAVIPDQAVQPRNQNIENDRLNRLDKNFSNWFEEDRFQVKLNKSLKPRSLN